MKKLFSPLGLTLLAIIALLPGIWSLPLVDRDEPRFAHATVEMMDRGDWVVPYFNDEYRFDKPPLTYWWMRFHFEIFGISEFSARLHSVISSWIIALLLFFFARRLGLSDKMAFLAGAGWLTALQVLIHSRLAVADMPLILFLVLTLSTLHKIISGIGKPLAQGLLLSLWMGLGFLAKGPLAYAIPLAGLLICSTSLLVGWKKSIAGFFLFGLLTLIPREHFALKVLVLLLAGGVLAYCSRELRAGFRCCGREAKAQLAQLWKGQKAFLLALIPSLLIVAAWGIPALIDTEGAYFGIGIGKHVVERGTGAMNKRFFLPGVFYLIVIIPFLLPWTAQLPGTIKKSLQSETLDSRFLLAWFVAPFLVFSFYATQLPHYILPGYPAFFLLLALFWKKKIVLGRLGHTIRVIALALPAVLGLILLILGLIQSQRGREALDLALLTSLIGGVMLSLAIIGASLLVRQKFARIATVSAFLSFTLFFMLATLVARQAHLTLRLREATGIPAGPLQASGYKEPTLVWYYDDFSDSEKKGFWTFQSLEESDPDQAALTLAVKKRWRIDDESWLPLLTLKEVPTADDNTEALVARYGQERIDRSEVVSGWSPGSSSWYQVIILR